MYENIQSNDRILSDLSQKRGRRGLVDRREGDLDLGDGDGADGDGSGSFNVERLTLYIMVNAGMRFS